MWRDGEDSRPCEGRRPSGASRSSRAAGQECDGSAAAAAPEWREGTLLPWLDGSAAAAAAAAPMGAAVPVEMQHCTRLDLPACRPGGGRARTAPFHLPALAWVCSALTSCQLFFNRTDFIAAAPRPAQ